VLVMGRTCGVLLVFLLLNACVAPAPTPLQEELSSKAVPVYEGPFSPIRVPIQLEHKPAALNLTGRLGIHTRVRDKNELLSAELHGRLRVLPASDSLLWEFILENALLGEEKVGSGNSPLMEFRARRDKHGVTKEAEIASLGMKVNSLEEKRLFEEIKALVMSQFRSFSAVLPASPIQGGTLLLETEMNAALQTYERLWGSPRCSPQKEKIGYAVRGLGSSKGREMIVAVIEEDFVCVARNERRYNFSMHGYALFDPITGQILENKAMTTVKSFYSFDSIELRMLQHMSADIME